MDPAKPAFQFDNRCEYFQEARSIDDALPMFRYREKIGSSVFNADTFGDGVWIDTSKRRRCPSECACRQLDASQWIGIFAFTVAKTETMLQVRIHSRRLRAEVLHVVASVKTPTEAPIVDASNTFDVFALMQCRRDLIQRMRHLREQATLERRAMVAARRLLLASEMSLLVNGLLNDKEILQPVGPSQSFKGLHPQQSHDTQLETHPSVTYLESPWQPSQMPPQPNDAYTEPRRACDDIGVPTYGNSYTTSTDQALDTRSFCDVDDSGARDHGDHGDDKGHKDHHKDNLKNSLKSSHEHDHENNSKTRQDNYYLSNLPKNAFPSSYSLSMSAFVGDEKEVYRLLEAGADPNGTQLPFYLGPALYEAARAGHESIVQVLIEHGASVEGVSINGLKSRTFRPLLAAIKCRSHKIAQLLLCHLSKTSLSEINLLETCPRHSRWIIARNLLECGFSPESLMDQAMELSNPDERLLSVLLNACSDPKTLEEDLQRRGHRQLVLAAKNRIAHNRGLIKAIECGSPIECEREIKAGADPSWALSTSLHLQRPDLARHLLTLGADARLLRIGRDLASEIGKANLSRMLAQSVRCNDRQLLDVLLDQGGDANSVDAESGESILVEAIKAESYACVEHLLQRGALVNGLGSPLTTPLTAALRARQGRIVGLLLKRGASYDEDPDGSMSLDCTEYQDVDLSEWIDLMRTESPTYKDYLSGTAIRTRNELHQESSDSSEARPVRLQLRNLVACVYPEHGTPEKALLEATRMGKVIFVQNILECASDGNGSRKAIPRQILSLDDLHDGSTCLMEAVRNGHLRIAKALLQYGADVNIMSPCETALSIAAKSSMESVFRLLLQHGADLHVAALMLRIDTEKTAGPGAIKRLNTMVKRYQDDTRNQNAGTKREIRLLHSAFRREHEHMKCIAFSDDINTPSRADTSKDDDQVLDRTTRLDISNRWAYSLELNSRRAWTIGQHTLKGLCRKVLPQDLNQTLLFLALAKSMSHVLDSDDRDQSRKEFEEDVGRWQLLFSEKDGGQWAFEQAVRSIWSINLARSNSDLLKPNEDDLDRFQAMALHVVQQTEDFYKGSGTGDAGLMSVRASWKLRQRDTLLQSLNVTQPDADLSLHIGDEEDRLEIPFHSINDNECQGFHYSPAPEETPNHWLLDPGEMLLAILMAGSIFTIVIGFFIAIGQSVFVTGSFEESHTGDILLSVRRESLKIIAASIFVETLPQKERSDKDCEEVVLEVRTQTNEAIRSGKINSNTSLANFFLEEIEHKFTGLGMALAASYSRMRHMNAMQNAYSVLRVSLGLPVRALRSSTPKHFAPRGCMIAKLGRKRKASEASDAGRSPKAARLSPCTADTSKLNPSSDDGRSAALSSEPLVVSTIGKVTFCVECNRDFKTTSNYGKHRNGPLHTNKRYPCAYKCGKDFLRNDIRLKHEKKAHQGIMATKPQLPGSISP